MALATKNAIYEMFGGAIKLMFAAYPTTSPGSASSDACLKGYIGLFYADGEICASPTTSEWANLTSEGVTVKLKQDTVKVDPNASGEHVIGLHAPSVEFELEIIDGDADHLKDIAAALTGDVVSVAASTTHAARTRTMVGGAKSPVYRTLCISQKSAITGEYDNFLIPRALLYLDSEIKLNKKNAYTLKVKGSGNPDVWLKDADGNGVSFVQDTVTAAKSAV